MALLPDQKFSTFQDGGDIAVGDIIVGLRDGVNTQFDYTGELPIGVIVPISQGGTGASNATDARTNLGLGTMAVQNADAVAITGGAAALDSGSVVAVPSAGIDIANKSYVDTALGSYVQSVSGTLNRVTSTGGQNPVINISASYVGQASITTVGTLVTGVWNATAIDLATYVTGNLAVSHLNSGTSASATTFWRGDGTWATPAGTGVSSVSGTANRITSSGGTTPVIDIAGTYTGQSSITTLGTIVTGTWNGTAIDLATYVTGNLSVSHLNSGTSAGATTFWRGDGTWATPSSVVNSGTANQIAYYATTGTAISGLTGANSATLVTNSTGVPSMTASMTNGQVLIGSTGATPTPATLTAGPGVSITNGAASITISGTGSGIGWTEVTGTSQAMTADSGWVANNAGLVTLTLPTTAAFGTAISIIGKGAGGWKIAQNASQIVQLGNTATTTGVGGSLASTNRFDSIDMICTTANTIWTVLGAPQSSGLTIV